MTSSDVEQPESSADEDKLSAASSLLSVLAAHKTNLATQILFGTALLAMVMTSINVVDFNNTLNLVLFALTALAAAVGTGFTGKAIHSAIKAIKEVQQAIDARK